MLRSLGAETLARLRPHLEPVELKRRAQIYAAGDGVDMIYFIDRGLASLVKPMSDGAAVEVGAVGVEGAVCLSGLLGMREAILESLVQIPGVAYRIRSVVFREAVDADAALKDVVLRYTEFALGQMAQIAACNTLHRLEHRFCRWLLVAHDASVEDTFPLTHEFLALMLGVQRPGVSLAASGLQRARLINYQNGRVTVIDRPGIEAAACECYEAMRARLDDLLGPP